MIEEAIVGGGCFWCLEAIFKRVKGVIEVESGYCGGKRENPTYEQVCSGATGHVEVVKIRFDNEKISYKDILEIFFSIHDPTQLNRQGADIGTQYRSVIFPLNEKQEEIAKEMIKKLNPIFNNKIVTRIEPLKAFYKAEDYHQNYYDNHPYQGYCQVVISPKIEKFKKDFKEYLNG
ncbi:peptide-methionine (S)-S-oxide reductase MsrA [Nitrosophilus kaiyonis]|uniref:peptide-methionine (S)-S-oxide reductase MsrA n=1 Tax=Nitrosophilus kaiyonis TaxID=2930200 RepID=UPI002491D6DC|nr:peptide-methionine (S)-S-oxide reductase MsrA [Nitrosophilus kaiyonis]